MERKGKRSRRAKPRASPPAPPPDLHAAGGEPECLLLDQIAAGDLDLHLTAIAEAIAARAELLQTIASAKALAGLRVGDQVRINHHASPRYLHGVEGRVLAVDESSATVCVHRPVGRFKSGEIRCPPLALDRLAA